MLIRFNYIDKLNELIDKPIIKALVGLRRVGKSTILKQFMDSQGLDKCMYIQLETFDMIYIRHSNQLIKYIQDNLRSNHKHILIDEIQLVEGRQDVANGLLATYNINIIITGSNSELLSSELSTILRGRVYQIFVYPFDLYEYCDFMSINANRESAISYLQSSGLPSVYIYEDKQFRVQELINTVFLRDIVARFRIKDIDLISSILYFVINNIGNQLNLSKIKSYLQTIGYDININTIGNYINYLIKSLLIYEVDNYDLQGKKIFDKTRKFYIADHGIRNYLFSRFDIGYGKQLENYIYIYLQKKGYHVYIGKFGDKEIDFVAEKGGNKIYIQSCFAVDSQQVQDREFGNLLLIKDNRPKYVVSMDDFNIGNIENIKHINLWDLNKYIL